MIQPSLGFLAPLESSAGAGVGVSCDCGSAVLVTHQLRNGLDPYGLPVAVVIRVARCLGCASELRAQLKPIETPRTRMERLRREVSA